MAHSWPICCILAGCRMKEKCVFVQSRLFNQKFPNYWSRELFWGIIIPKALKCNLDLNSSRIFFQVAGNLTAWTTTAQHYHLKCLSVICSLSVELKFNLDQYVNKRYPGLVKIVRNSKREGLIRARIHGWNAATAPVVGFFDAHVEFNTGW